MTKIDIERLIRGFTVEVAADYAVREDDERDSFIATILRDPEFHEHVQDMARTLSAERDAAIARAEAAEALLVQAGVCVRISAPAAAKREGEG